MPWRHIPRNRIAVSVERPSDLAANQPPIGITIRIPPAIRMAWCLSLLKLRVERRIVKMRRVVDDRRRSGLELTREMQSQRTQIAHLCLPEPKQFLN